MRLFTTCCLLLLTFAGPRWAFSRQVSQEIELQYYLKSDGTISLQVSILDDEDYEPVVKNAVNFYSTRGSDPPAKSVPQ